MIDAKRLGPWMPPQTTHVGVREALGRTLGKWSFPGPWPRGAVASKLTQREPEKSGFSLSFPSTKLTPQQRKGGPKRVRCRVQGAGAALGEGLSHPRHRSSCLRWSHFSVTEVVKKCSPLASQVHKWRLLGWCVPLQRDAGF